MLLYAKVFIVLEVLLVAGLMFYKWALTRQNRRVVTPKVVVLILLTPAFGLFSHNAYVFYAYLAVAIAFTSRTRAEMASIYVMMMPMMPELRQQAAAGGLYLFPFSSIFAMNAGAMIGLAFLARTKAKARPELDFAALMLILLFVLIDARGLSLTSTLRSSFTFALLIGVPYLVMSRSIATRADLDRVLLRLCLAAVLGSIVAIFESARHWLLYSSFTEALHVPLELGSATLSVRGGRMRVGGPMLDYTAFGAFLAVIVIMLPSMKHHFTRSGRYAIVTTVLIALFATQSRGAWLAAVLGYVATLFYRGSKVRALLILGAAGAAQLIVSVAIPKTSKLAETLGTSGASAATADYRRTLFVRGMDMVRAHPILGQTPKQLVASLPDLVQGQHIVDFVNTHLFVLMSTGVVGFAIWAGAWITCAAILLRRNRGKSVAVELCAIPIGILATSMVVLLFTSTIDRNLIWPMLAMGLTAPCITLARVPAMRRTRSNLREQSPLVSLVVAAR